MSKLANIPNIGWGETRFVHARRARKLRKRGERIQLFERTATGLHLLMWKKS